MATVISASHRFTSEKGRYDHFVRQAEDLLRQSEQAHWEGNFSDSVEYAYRAALRTAGAWVEKTAVARRRRKPTGAWAQLRLAGNDALRWAIYFEGWSRRRLRIVQGYERDSGPEVSRDLQNHVAEFLADLKMLGSTGGAAA